MKNRQPAIGHWGEKGYEEAYVVGRYGFAGSHTHLCHVMFRVEDAGQPWERLKFLSARPLCSGNRRGDKDAHSLQLTAELNEKTITCEKCREFGMVEKAESQAVAA
jgi:hypothetical protein